MGSNPPVSGVVSRKLILAIYPDLSRLVFGEGLLSFSISTEFDDCNMLS